MKSYVERKKERKKERTGAWRGVAWRGVVAMLRCDVFKDSRVSYRIVSYRVRRHEARAREREDQEEKEKGVGVLSNTPGGEGMVGEWGEWDGIERGSGNGELIRSYLVLLLL